MDLHGIQSMNLMILALFLILLSTVLNQCVSSSTPKQQKQNNIAETLNPSKRRIPLKTIKSRDGDIIDCIKISEQPAFDHPLLHNHTILTTPSFYPQGMLSPEDHNENQITQLWTSEGSCPGGTIPIRRPETNSKYPGNTSFSSQSVQLNDNRVAHYAFAFIQDNRFHGAKGYLNVWQPHVNLGEYSSSQIWVSGGPTPDLSSVEAGWHVAPEVYGGGKKTRFFIYWRDEGSKTGGCYNLRCPGFVQVNRKVLLGGAISPLSIYHGEQHDINLFIWKDSAQHAWWVGYNNLALGYFPAWIFRNLRDFAQSARWGGKVLNWRPKGQGTTTQMGSGHFAAEGFGAANYFRHLQVLNEDDVVFTPAVEEVGTSLELERGCYTIELYNDLVLGNYILFGGPGNSPKCHF